MSINLKLLPMHHENNSISPIYFSNSILHCGDYKSYKFYDDFRNLVNKIGLPIPSGFACYLATIKDGKQEGGSCYGETNIDDFGWELKMITAQQFLDYMETINVDLGFYFKASIEYVKQLPKDLFIVIYWS